MRLRNIGSIVQGNALLEARTNLAPEYIRQVVRNGIMGMPRITRAELSNSELQAVVSYLSHVEQVK
ncbi:MAG: cytochrome c, partial [Gammaproteobacteria bacterium]